MKNCFNTLWQLLSSRTLLGLFALSAAGVGSDIVPKQGGVCFRFDDNHPVEQWQEMVRVFEKHDCRFSISVIPGRYLPPNYAGFLQQMEQKGFELMDHSPNHGMFKFDAQNEAERLEAAKLAAYIDHWSGNRACFKFIRNPRYAGIPLVCDVAGKKPIL